MENVATSVRISPTANAILARLTAQMGNSKSSVVEAALAAFEASQFEKQVARAYAELRQNESAWRDYMNEVGVWDKLAADGLPDGPGAGS